MFIPVCDKGYKTKTPPSTSATFLQRTATAGVFRGVKSYVVSCPGVDGRGGSG